MNLQGKLFLVLLIVGVAVGTQDGGPSSANAERVCPSEITSDVDVPVYRNIPNILVSCFDALKIDEQIFVRANATAEEIQSTCNEICRREAEFQQCLDEQAANLEVCPNPVNVIKIFNIGRGVASNAFEYGCADGAKRFFTIMMWMNVVPQTSPVLKQFEHCSYNMMSVIRALSKSEVDISSKMYIFHNECVKFVDCTNLANDDQPSKEVLEHFSKVVMTTTMKCINPQDGALVPCASISVDQLSAPTICKVTTHGSKLDIHDILENNAGRCFDIKETDAREQDVTFNEETLREDINGVCSMKGFSLRCFDEQKIISNICLNETQKTEINLLVDSVKKGMNAACLEDGKRLADIMFEVYRLKRTGHGHAVWDCIDSAKATRNDLNEHTSSSKNMRFYHELETFKGCLVNKLGDDVTSVASATSLIDEMLKNIECVNVTDGTTVTCESLMHHHH